MSEILNPISWKRGGVLFLGAETEINRRVNMFGIKSTKQFMAAQNALVAKYTFANLNDGDKGKVAQDTAKILQEGGFQKEDALKRVQEFLNDEKYQSDTYLEGYLLFSVAMLRLGIAPALHGILYDDSWNIIKKNPFVILIGAEKEINKVKLMIKNKCNVDIDKC